MPLAQEQPICRRRGRSLRRTLPTARSMRE